MYNRDSLTKLPLLPPRIVSMRAPPLFHVKNVLPQDTLPLETGLNPLATTLAFCRLDRIPPPPVRHSTNCVFWASFLFFFFPPVPIYFYKPSDFFFFSSLAGQRGSLMGRCLIALLCTQHCLQSPGCMPSSPLIKNFCGIFPHFPHAFPNF